NRERASRLRFRHRPPSARGDATNLFATFLYTVARRSKSSASGDRDARQVVGGGEKVEALRPAHPRRRRRRRPRATGATAGGEGPVPPAGVTARATRADRRTGAAEISTASSRRSRSTGCGSALPTRRVHHSGGRSGCHTRRMPVDRLLVVCPDRPGVVAAVSTFLFERRAN